MNRKAKPDGKKGYLRTNGEWVRYRAGDKRYGVSSYGTFDPKHGGRIHVDRYSDTEMAALVREEEAEELMTDDEWLAYIEGGRKPELIDAFLASRGQSS